MSAAEPRQAWADAPARERDCSSLRELLDSLIWRLRGVTELEARMALMKAADEFLRTSKAWREPIRLPRAPLPRFGANPHFPFPGSAGASVAGASCCSNPSGMGVPVGLVGGGGPGNPFRYGAWELRGGPVPELYWCGSLPPWMLPAGISPPAPVAYFTLAPGADELPERILRAWGEAIADGAFAQLAMMEGRPWTDRASAAAAATRFHAAIVTARAESEPRDAEGQPTVRGTRPLC